VTIVAVDAPLRATPYWTAQMMAVWRPVAVWAVVEATRKPEDLEPWIDELPGSTRSSCRTPTSAPTPAAVLRRADTPVALRRRSDARRRTAGPRSSVSGWRTRRMSPFRWDVLLVGSLLALPVLGSGCGAICRPRRW
jgi:hypothetical protein